MSDENQPLRPEHVFKKIIWRSTLSFGSAIEQFTTWTLTGTAAIIALLVSNIDSVGKIVSIEGIRLSLVLFTLSLLTGVISKQLGMAVGNGIIMIEKLENLLQSEAGQKLMSGMTTPIDQLTKELSGAFIWPMSWIARRGGKLGARDYLSTDKKFIRIFCWQLYFNVLHGLLGAVALLVIAISLQYPAAA
jgi:hypothetical protein